MQGTQTDNKFFGTKIRLRRFYLQKYHQRGPFSVFDTCCGDGHIWRELRKDFPRIEYFGADHVKTALKVDSARLCQDPAYAQFDVIDIDTYGSPWSHYFNLLPNIKKPTTIFLTIGSSGARNNMPNVMRAVLGLDQFKYIPTSILARINGTIGTDYCIMHAERFGLAVSDIREGFPKKNARCIGLRLEPKKT